MFVQRREQPASDGLWAFQPDPKELERWPYLLEHLGVQKYDDKKPRVTSSFSVFAEGGMLKVSFSDRDNGQVGFKSLDGLAALCDVLEEALHHGGFDWRLSRNQQPRRR